jgi:hypothetical protein
MAIAHEVGHLLLPNNSHSFVGIMRADLELTSMLPQEFTPQQSATIRASLSGDAGNREATERRQGSPKKRAE